MAGHKVYSSIIKAIESDKLKEPFTNMEFRKFCIGLGEGTYRAFLDKHRVGNPGGNSELFVRTKPGMFKLLRPIKYGL